MTITPDPATGRMTGTSLGVVSTTQTYSTDGVPDVVNATVSGATELNFVYNIDARGRMGTISESGHFTRDTTYVYDAAGRLWQVWRGGAIVEQYDHVGSDGANGNRTAWTAGGSTFTATYDGQDRLQSYTENGTVTELGYDAHGNVASRTTGGAVTTYTWDPRGPLASVQRPGGAALIEYVLDPSGRRIGRKVGGALERGWLYGGGLLPVAETDGDGSTVRRVFVYATRGHVPDLVRQREGESWVTYRVLTDHLGSVRAVANTASGQVVQRMDYDAFGRVVLDETASGWTAIPFGYAGGLYDRDTGLVRFGAREYDARLGRWVSRDPILFSGGDTNLYRYCGGDPVNYVDVDGEFPRLPLESVGRIRRFFGRAGLLIALRSAWEAVAYHQRDSGDDQRVREVIDWFYANNGGDWYSAAGDMTAFRRGESTHHPPFGRDEPCMVAAEHYGVNRRDVGHGQSPLMSVAYTVGYEVAKISSVLFSSALSTTDRPTTPASYWVTDWAVSGAADARWGLSSPLHR